MIKTEYIEIHREEIKTQGKQRKEPSGKRIFNPKFRFLGFAMGRNRKGAYIRVHAKSKKKAKGKLRKLTSRKQMKDLQAVDIMTYPRHTSPCT